MPLCNGLYFTEFHPQRVSINQPIIFLHGAGGNRLFWPAALRRLPNTCTFSMDLPGHGQSDPPGRQAVQQYRQSIEAWLVDANIKNAILVGFGLGGKIALQYAINNPQNIDRLILINTFFQPTIQQISIDRLCNPITFKNSVMELIKNHFHLQTGNQAHQILIKSILQTRPAVLAGDLFADSENIFLSHAEGLSLPTCIMESILFTQQFSISENYLQNTLPNAQIHLYPHPSHMLPLDAPRWVANIIQEFIQQEHIPEADTSYQTLSSR